jgi:hypothetical protein
MKHYFTLLLFLFFPLIAFAQVNLQQGLVAYYPFYGNANDESGNGHHGIVYGATLTEDRFGNESSAYFFNGNSNYISVNSSSTLNVTKITVSAWIKLSRNVSEDQARIICRQNTGSGTEAWGLQIFKNNNSNNIPGNYLAFHANNGSQTRNIVSDHSLSISEWFHVLGINDGQFLKLYINGSLDTIIPSLGLVFWNNTAPARIGRTAYSYYFFPGVIDDIRIYNRALNDQEILALYFENSPYGPIANIQVSQRYDGSGLVDVYFDLNGPADNYNINIEVSFDGGLSYSPIPQEHLSGSLTGISPGNQRHIVWNGLGSHPNLYSTSTKLKIVAH